MEEKTAYNMHWYVCDKIPQLDRQQTQVLLPVQLLTHVSLSQNRRMIAARQIRRLSCAAPEVRHAPLRSADDSGSP